MHTNYHFNVVTNKQNYAFDLIAKGQGQYEVKPADEKYRSIVEKLFENAKASNAFKVAENLRFQTGVQDVTFSSIEQLPETKEISTFREQLPRKGNAIDLDSLEIIPGGGTHNIYKLKGNSKFLLKVMKPTVGDKSENLRAHLDELTTKYSQLYKVFGEDNCLVETRFIDFVNETEEAIVSIVRFDTCFASKEKFGYNTEPVERDIIHIFNHLESYHRANLGFIGSAKANLNDFLIHQETFRPIFKLLDENLSFRETMSDFLSKFKVYYGESNQFMDFIGRDNVLFYKENNQWHYKVGSVIKHETGKGAQEMLQEIDSNPKAIHDSFQNWTHVFYVPSWIRALNATALKLGMPKVIDNFSFTEKDSENLATIHKQLAFYHHASSAAVHHEFDKALEYLQGHDTIAYDTIATEYWKVHKENDRPKEEILKYLELLIDPRNDFPSFRYEIVNETVRGLEAKYGEVPEETKKRINETLKKIDKKE